MAGLSVPGLKPKTAAASAYGGAIPALDPASVTATGYKGFTPTKDETTYTPPNYTGYWDLPNAPEGMYAGVDTAHTLPPWMRPAPAPVGVPGGAFGAAGGNAAGLGGSQISLDDVMGLMGRFQPSSAGRVPPPSSLGSIAAPGATVGAATASPTMAESQGWARVKDASGRIGQSALKALREQMTARGISGSGIEAEQTGNILGQVARGQSEAAARQNLGAEQNAWEAAKTGYEGAITQRAQDLGLTGAGYAGQVTQRAQDLSGQQAWQALLPHLLNLVGRRY